MKLVKFVGWKGTYASFQIERKMLPNGIVLRGCS